MTNPRAIEIEYTQVPSGTGEDGSLEGKALVDSAAHDAAHQHDLTIRQAIKYYRWAIFWCLAVSMTVIMEGYDAILLGNFWAYPTFQRKYGVWRFGPRNTILGALIVMVFCVFAPFFAQNVETLLAGQILCGLPWGVFASSSPAYASELLPMKLRVYFTSWTNMCFIIGQFLASGVLRACLVRDDEWGYRIPFALQWFWPAWLIPLLYFAPESPWHLVRRGRLEEAERSLERLQDADAPLSTKETLAYIVCTNNLEQKMSVGTGYLDCLRGFELRRTEIAAVSFGGQVLCGTALAYNATYFYEQIGLPASRIYTLNVAGYGLALAGAFCSWLFLLPHVGRRTIYLWGSGVMCFLLYLIAVLTSWKSHQAVAESQAYLTMVWKFVFQLSAGQLGWAIPAEIGSTRLRQKTVVLARNAYYLIHVVANILQPYFMNPTAWNVGARTGFLWGSTALLFFAWAFWRLPETKDRTYEELDVLFANRTPARKFRSTKVDVFGQDAHELKASHKDLD
ncbi:maltose permease MAL31 [Pyricularia oryzae Y34]|uniref:Maltose permease MAL31 n=1 Tax=Pyricularia oryzae (strain Y34) TaxID=1143189 RepID=A0AA97PAC5_PYRO3|nr:maltose permease MAL31 [Pyricularia oryzae Y34]